MGVARKLLFVNKLIPLEAGLGKGETQKLSKDVLMYQSEKLVKQKFENLEANMSRF